MDNQAKPGLADQELVDATEECNAALLGMRSFHPTAAQRTRYQIAMHELLHAEIRHRGEDPELVCGECE